MKPNDTGASPKAPTFTTANVVGTNAIMTSIATAATAQSYTDAELNGAKLIPAPDSKTGYAQYPTATLSASAGSYVNGSLITVTGTYLGAVTVSTITVVGTGGGVTLVGDKPLDGAVTAVNTAAQHDTSGALTVGWADLLCPYRNGKLEPWREVRAGSSGNIGVIYPGDVADILPSDQGERHTVLIPRIKTSTTTCTSFTLYE
jgi:hypothetical protein